MDKKIIVTCKGADILPIDSLEDFQGGLKKITKTNLEKLKRRIIKDGINVPMFIWRTNDWCRILDGHQRLKALLSLREDGYELPLIPVAYIEADDEADARQKLLGITSQYGEFEIEELGEWMRELDEEIAGTLRLADEEIRIKPNINDIDAEPDIDHAEKLREKWGVESGQLWQLGDHKIFCGDSGDENIVKKIIDEKAHLVFTDPPYGVGIGDKNKFLNSFHKAGRNLKNIEFDKLNFKELKKELIKTFTNIKNIVMADDCTVFVTAPQGGELGMMMMMMMMESGLPVRHVLMWLKNSPTFSLGRLDYDYQHEPILLTWGKRHKRPMLGEHRTSVWKIDKPRASADHPTMKPVALIVNALLNNSDLGDIVFDAYSGSGTTIIAAEQTGRRARVIEIDPGYVAVAIQRWVDATGGIPKLC
jgi:DNA modification methylase